MSYFDQSHFRHLHHNFHQYHEFDIGFDSFILVFLPREDPYPIIFFQFNKEGWFFHVRTFPFLRGSFQIEFKIRFNPSKTSPEAHSLLQQGSRQVGFELVLSSRMTDDICLRKCYPAYPRFLHFLGDEHSCDDGELLYDDHPQQKSFFGN